MNKFLNKDLIAGVIHTGIVHLARSLKVSWIVGSHMAFFSLAHCINPLVGLYAGFSATLLALFIKIGFSWYGTSMTLLPLLVYHIPSFCGALYLNKLAKETPSLFTRLAMAALPAICMALFAAHAVGNGALAYTLFWLIPITLALVPHRNMFAHALGATFTCHAVGSVLWLYTINALSAQAWLALIPVVMVERLFFASGMTLCVLAVNKLKALSAHYKLSPLSSHSSQPL